MSRVRLILMPGLGCDHRLFGPQRDAGLPVEVPRMVPPEPGDDMARYALRIRRQMRIDGPSVIGGVSFGGMVACELAAICDCRALLVVASSRSAHAVPRYGWLMEWASRGLPDSVIRNRCVASSRIMAWFEGLNPTQYELLRDMSRDVPVPFLRRAARMLLAWTEPSPLTCSVHQIHGRRDRIIPLRRLSPPPDEIVPDGGHLINLTHADIVNRFISERFSS